MYASPSNNYWLVGDQDPDMRWSSGSVAYVAATDATYLAWLAAGFETSEISTEQELADLLNATYPAGSPIPPPFVPITGTGPMAVGIINGTPGSANVGQYTVPAGVHKLMLFGQAAGGGGGGSGSGSALVGGGGGAGETRMITLAVNPGDLIDYTIGAEGAAAAAGVNAGGAAADTIIGGSPSPVPSIIATNTTNDAAMTTTHAIALPAGIAAGDFLLMAMLTYQNTHTVATPAGWTLLVHQGYGGGAGEVYIFYKQNASGAEGASVTITATAAVVCYAISYLIRGHDPAVAPLQASQASSGSSGKNVALPPVNAAAMGAVNKLWLAIGTCYNNLSGVPSGFSDAFSPATPLVRGSWYGSNATLVDPTTYAIGGTSYYTGHTIAIKAVPPTSIMQCKGGTGGAGNNGTGGITPTGSGAGSIRIPPAGAAFSSATAAAIESRGGSSFFGLGASRASVNAIAGQDATGPGGGGSGGGNGSSSGTTRGGGAGGPGMLLVVGFG